MDTEHCTRQKVTDMCRLTSILSASLVRANTIKPLVDKSSRCTTIVSGGHVTRQRDGLDLSKRSYMYICIYTHTQATQIHVYVYIHMHHVCVHAIWTLVTAELTYAVYFKLSGYARDQRVFDGYAWYAQQATGFVGNDHVLISVQHVHRAVDPHPPARIQSGGWL